MQPIPSTAPHRLFDAPADHLGWQAAVAAHRLLQVDEAWTLWHDDGFTWWAHRLAQRFRFEGPVEVDGSETWWLSCETDCLRGVDGDVTAVLAWLLGHNRLTNVGAWVLQGDRLRVRARVAVRREALEERVQTLVERAMVVNALAHRHEAVVSDGLATTLGSPGLAFDASGHPERGERPEPDELLGVLATYQTATEAGDIDPERLPNLNGAIQVGLIHGGWVTGGRQEGWVNCRFAWGEEGLRFTPPGGVVFRAFADDPPVVDVRVEAGQRHPVLGPGTLVRVIVPAPAGLSFAEGVRWANTLNLAELEAPLPLSSTGAWVWTPGAAGDADTVTWASFFPDATARPELAAFEVFSAKARADWFVAGPGRGLRPGSERLELS